MTKRTPDQALLETLKAEFQAAADPERAAYQQAYMKSAMPYYGILRHPDPRSPAIAVQRPS